MRTFKTGVLLIGSVSSSIVACIMRHAPCCDHCSCASGEWQARFAESAITLVKMPQHDMWCGKRTKTPQNTAH
jgi:hypothetical protein